MTNGTVLEKDWIFQDIDEKNIQSLSFLTELDYIFCKILNCKKITSENIQDYLFPKIKKMLPNPYIFKDMNRGIENIYKHIEKKNKICIYGDYDVDGASSTAILSKYLKSLNIKHEIYIPDRIKDGYGPNKKIFEKLIKNDNKLIITLDCGTLAFDSILFAKTNKIDTIIIDHHKSIEILPDANAVINPNRFDESGKYNYLCAAGLVFIFLVALNKFLREKKYFYTNKTIEPNLLKYLDLVMLGTVCDVVPLIDLNRAFVKQGLKVFSERENLGLKTLSDISEIDHKFTSKDIAFVIGPKINAAGRIGDSSLAANLLLSDDPEYTYSVAKKLHDLNLKRKKIEKIILEGAIFEAEKQKNENVLVLSNKEWHEGVTGIIASRIKDLYDKPTVVISINGDLAKGSARSINGFDMGIAIIKMQQKKIIVKGGGHSMAGGFSLKTENIIIFKDEINNIYQKKNKHLKKNKLIVDFPISLDALDEKFIDYLNNLEPFGSGNREPVILINNTQIAKPIVIKEKHIKFFFKHNNKHIEAISFNCAGKPLGEYLLKKRQERFDAVCKLSINYWNNRQFLQLILLDLKVMKDS